MSETKGRWKIWGVVAIVLLVLGVIPLAYVSTVEDEDMGLLIGEKVCLFSGFAGQVMLNGEPASGAKLTRTYEFKNTEHKDVVTADEEGRFSFESVWDKQRGLVVQFVSRQKILVEYQGQEHLIWTGGKLIEEEFGEFGGAKPQNLRCELGEDLRRVDMEMGFIGTTCHWDQ
ncbi:DUF6795 domain-containing protein [Aurantivibrio plasticivorans]